MECPKCHKNVGENDAICRNCGIALKDVKKKSIKVFFKDKKKSAENNLKMVKRKATSKKAKIAFASVAALLVILLIILLIVHFSGEQGNKIAGEYAEYVGDTLTNAENDLGKNVKGDSSFRGVNNSMNFDYIFESEDEIRIDDISYPKWAVTVNLNESKKIDSVVYTDFEQVKDDLRGEKKSKMINLEKFDKGTKFKTVSEEIDLDPYSITYKKETITYLYKYYYMTDYGDAQSVILSVTFDNDDNKLLYSSEELVYPKNL